MNRSSADGKEEMKMENRPIIKKEQVETVYDSRFIKVFDLQYEPGKHYFDATRRSIENLAAGNIFLPCIGRGNNRSDAL